MGQRANLVIVNQRGYEVYYCHWCANRLERDLFWGHEFAPDYIRKQQATEGWEHGGWLDERWAEGGVILDPERKVLLLYGGEDIIWEIPLRRLYLQLLQKVWAGWTVRWAHDGMLDMVDYLGVSRSIVEVPELANREPDVAFSRSRLSPASPAELKYVTWSAASVKLLNGSMTIFLARGRAKDTLQYGEALLEAVQSQEGLTQWQQPADKFFRGGFHIDMVEKKLSIWEANAPNIVRHIQSRWTDWQIEWLKDDFETHIALTQNRLQLDLPSDEELLSRLEQILLRESSSPIDSLPAILEYMKRGGEDVQVNPNIFHDNPQKLGLAVRRKIFEKAVNDWKLDRQNGSKQPDQDHPECWWLNAES